MGDFNINYADKKSANFEKLCVLESEYSLKQLINKPTRVTYHSRSTIDLIFTNIVHVKTCGVVDHPIADHLPVYVIKKRPRENYTNYFLKRQNFNIMIGRDSQRPFPRTGDGMISGWLQMTQKNYGIL